MSIFRRADHDLRAIGFPIKGCVTFGQLPAQFSMTPAISAYPTEPALSALIAASNFLGQEGHARIAEFKVIKCDVYRSGRPINT